MYSGDSPSGARTPTSTPAVTPMLRTVLLCDLVDSTALVERLGDTRAMLVFQRHDQLLLETLDATQGRLIDKADGLLALFERPVQAVDFALRYQRALHLLGVELGLPLKARLGIHVGDVMTWNNSPHAVSAGAKPMEVEGLAKPVAARLMALALPGQILLSGMAQSLAQRAQAELGESAAKVRWLVHGRYRFKGVPAPMIVHEVGEPGYAPFRLPPSGQKGWREIPLWRRPPVLALEMLVVAVVAAVSLWSTFKSEPALAFSERDWVVVGDLSNFTGDPRLEESLDTALRVSLEQSRYVNLIPDLRLREALQRMGRSEQTTVDRAIGSEIALREGARALLLPSVAEVGGRLRVNIEVVDPNTQVTVYAESAEGRGAESALASLDTVGAELREKLGESLGDIEANGKPLAQVTTGNLDALRAYSLAMDAGLHSRYDEALRLFGLAIQRDPDFALAFVHRGQLQIALGDYASARKDILAAQKLRGRLTLRESLLLDANATFFQTPRDMVEQWKSVSKFYPDIDRAYYRAAQFEAFFFQRYQQALETLKPALRGQSSSYASSLFLSGLLYLGLDQYEQANAAFDRQRSIGGRGYNRQYADLFAAQRRYQDAMRVLRDVTSTGVESVALEMRLPEVSYALDQGQFEAALQANQKIRRDSQSVPSLLGRTHQGIEATLLAYRDGPAALPAVRTFIRTERQHALAADTADSFHSRFAVLYGAALAARLGDVASAESTLAAFRGPATSSGYPAAQEMVAIVEAELALARNKPTVALEILKPLQKGGELNIVHAVLLRAYLANNDLQAANHQAEWLVTHRGRAFVEWNSEYMLQPANVLETDLAVLRQAEIALALGKTAEARERLAAFNKIWPKPPGFVARRLAELSRQISLH